MKKALIIVTLLIVGAVCFGAPSDAKGSAKTCSVIDLRVTEETLSRPGETRILGYRWVRTETVRCGDRVVEITTRGEYQRNSPFKNR